MLAQSDEEFRAGPVEVTLAEETPVGSSLPHVRSQGVPWLVTAGALASVIAVGVLVAPDEVSARPTAEPPVSAPDPRDAAYPLDCPGTSVVVASSARGDLDGDGRTETVAAVHCDAGNGSPPHEIYVLGPGRTAGAEPRIVARLLDSQQQMTVERLSVEGPQVTAGLLGYSSPDVPRYSPDVQETRSWEWKAGRFLLGRTSLPAST
ncbi:hypothetical protein AQ490_14160 [Wenjunlia vitaminophila]|uniref:Uncharacterized protein n=1 Tax=Wenjunlia vitaminophila TaxID=76728 RepID=A0A0T6LW64_WENVI|nr:hypothetical protein [Wenjunlia vitaminophila]KRV50256.1 hypothetical protein AQ490_14160 [Wenjunlia vitaminophila]